MTIIVRMITVSRMIKPIDKNKALSKIRKAPFFSLSRQRPDAGKNMENMKIRGTKHLVILFKLNQLPV